MPDRLEKGSCLTQDCKLSPNARFNLFVNVQPTAVSFLSIVSFRQLYTVKNSPKITFHVKKRVFLYIMSYTIHLEK